jgi:ribosomal protein S18 acetylase RimI-like enzyme
MILTFCEDYWDNPELKNEFKKFMIQLFGLDLSPWNNAGFWDNQYRPFSYFSGSSLVSNVCVYSMDMTVKGERVRVAQLSAAATKSEYRRNGLCRDLTNKAIDWAQKSHDFYFLFADEDATAFYERCGFRRVQEYKTRTPLSACCTVPGIIQLDMTQTAHVELVYRLVCERESISHILGVHNSKLLMFWCLTYLNDTIHYLEDLDLLILYKRDGGLLTIYDIVGAFIPRFAKIYPYISRPHDVAVDFLFMTDKMGLDAVELVEVHGNGTHLLGNFPLESTQFIFPYTSHA